MISIQTIEVGNLNTNCYFLIDEQDKCLIVDPGDNADFLAEELMRQNLEPELIVATHGHYDHILAASELQAAFGIPFLVGKEDEFLVKEMKNRAQHWIGRSIIQEPPSITGYLQQDELLSFGQESLEVLASPGHTPGGVVLYSHKERMALTGDTLFADAVGRTDLSYSSKSDLKQSLAKINSQLADFTGYPGHGPRFVISR